MFSRKRENLQKHDDFVEVKKHNNKNKNGFANKVIKSFRIRPACLVEKKVMMMPIATTSDFDSGPSLFSSRPSSDSSSGVFSLADSRNLSPLRIISCFKPGRTRADEPEKLGIKSSSKVGSLKKMKQAIISPFLFFANNNGKPKNTGKGKPLEAEPPPEAKPVVEPPEAKSAVEPQYSVWLPELEGIIIGEELDIIAQPQFVARNNGKSFRFTRQPSTSANGVKRTVRFDPVGVIVDQDCRQSRPSEERSISNNFYTNQEDDEDDNWSDSSSDLFEINHLATNNFVFEIEDGIFLF